MVEIPSAIVPAAMQVIFVLLFSPLIIGIMRKVKARFQGRSGSPIIQPYLDVLKLLSKGSAKSSVTSFIFSIAPIFGFVSVAIAALFLPIFPQSPLFGANVIIFIYLFAIGRFLTALSGLDAGSAFGGMGSSREMFYSIVIEPAFFAIIVFLVSSGGLGIAPIAPDMASWSVLVLSPVYWLIAIALFIAILAETGRIPFDNPATHLELTMVHEAMILENSGPGLALIEWAQAAKIFLFFSLMAILLLPGSLQSGPVWPAMLLASVMAIGVVVAAFESISVKMRLFKVPELLVFSALLAILAFLIRVSAGPSGGENVLQSLLAFTMLLSALYFLFSITIRQRVGLYVVQSTCLVLTLLSISLSPSGGMNFVLLAIIALLKIFIIPYVLFRSISYGASLMPLNYYLRFGESAKKSKSSLGSDPMFMASQTSTISSLLYASVLVALAFLMAPALGSTSILLPIVISLILIGMLIIASKTHLILQLLGYLIMENGVVLLPTALHINLPFIGELVALFDVIILVRITLLLSFKMQETHGTLDTKQLAELVEKR